MRLAMDLAAREAAYARMKAEAEAAMTIQLWWPRAVAVRSAKRELAALRSERQRKQLIADADRKVHRRQRGSWAVASPLTCCAVIATSCLECAPVLADLQCSLCAG
jgi:hypothetical protein